MAESSVPGAVGLEGPEFGRVFGKVMQQYPKADIRLVNAVLRIAAESGGAVGEREELDVERLREAHRLAQVMDGDYMVNVATVYARLSVNEGGVAPVEPPPRQGVIVGAPETTRAEPTWTVTAPVARTEAEPHE